MIKKENKINNYTKRILIISDSFENETFSVSKLMTDLLIELSSRNYEIDIITQTPKEKISSKIEEKCGSIHFAKNLFNKTHIKILRGLDELFFSFQIAKYLTFNRKKYISTIWYSPSIFIGLGIKISLNKNKLGKKIMIIRDIFPDWLIDTGIISKNSIYFYILNFIEKFQYSISDIILPQSLYDKKLILENKLNKQIPVDILYSWYTINNKQLINNDITNVTDLSPYVLCLGNFGVAQDIDKFINFINNVSYKTPNINYIFLGLKDHSFKIFNKIIIESKLKNIHIFKPTMQENIPTICEKALCGIYSLNNNFKTNNIPGRFVMYSLNGLKSFGIFTNNLELSKIINENNFGVYTYFSDPDISNKFISFIDNEYFSKEIIKSKSREIFSTKYAADRILKYLN